MPADDYEHMHTRREAKQIERDELLEALLKLFSSQASGLFTIEELVIVVRYSMADVLQFRPHITDDELEVLRSAERRILGTEHANQSEVESMRTKG